MFFASATGTGTVTLDRRYAPWPLNPPEHPQLKSEHQMISGPGGPGDLLVQDFGWGPGRYKFTLRLVPPSILGGIKALYFSWVSGKRADVRFNDDAFTWLCQWDMPWQPERGNTRAELYNLEVGLILKSVVEEE